VIAGIEGLHAWTPPGAGSAAVVLGEAPYKLTEVTGLDSLAATEDNRDPRIGGIGTIPRPSQRREKPVTYTGWIECDSLLELHEAKANLRAAFAVVRSEGRMDVAWHEDLAEMAAVPPKFYEARPVLCEIVDRQEMRGYKRRFVLGLVNGDGRYFDEESEAYTVEIEETNTGYEFE
jgi:hypothetical protein